MEHAVEHGLRTDVVRGVLVGGSAGLLFSFDGTHDVLRRFLTEPVDGPVLAVVVGYPDSMTRVSAIAVATVLAIGITAMWSRTRGRTRTKTLILAAGLVVASIGVRSAGLNRHLYAGLAVRLWLVALVVMAVAIPLVGRLKRSHRIHHRHRIPMS